MNLSRLKYSKHTPIDDRLSLVVNELCKSVVRDKPGQDYILRYCANAFASHLGRETLFNVPVQVGQHDAGDRTLDRMIDMIPKTPTQTDAQKVDFRFRKMQKDMARMKRRQDREIEESVERAKAEEARLDRARHRKKEYEERRQRILETIKAEDSQAFDT